MPKQDPYTRAPFNSGVTANSKNNFQRFDAAVKNRQALRMKMKEQEKIDRGTFTPEALQIEANQSFGQVYNSLNGLLQETGVNFGASLSNKSDVYNPKNASMYSNLKKSSISGIKKMNNAMSYYQTFQEAYAKGDLDFSPDEYEALQEKWGRLNETVQDPDRFGFDKNGNATVAVWNEEEGKDDNILLSEWEDLNFENIMKPVAEPNYTKMVGDILHNNPKSNETDINGAILQMGGRESPNFLGYVMEYLEETYPNSPPDGIEKMAMDAKYQDEAMSAASERKRNTHNPAKRTGSKPTLGRPDVDKVFMVPGDVSSDVTENSDGTFANEDNLREYMQDQLNTFTDYDMEVVAEYMKSAGYPSNYTEDDVLDAWVKRETSSVKAWEAANAKETGAAGYVDEDVKAKGVVNFTVSRGGSPTVKGERRYDTDVTKYDKNQPNQYEVGITDNTGFGHLAYDIEKSAEGALVTVDYTPTANAGAIILGQIGEYASGKSKGKPINHTHHSLDVGGNFSPERVLNMVPMLNVAVNFPNHSQVGSSRTTGKVFTWDERNEEAFNSNLKKGAILTDELLAMLKEEHPDTWEQMISYGSAVSGQFKISASEGNAEYTMLVPLNDIKGKMEQLTNHNFSNMSDPEHTLGLLSREELVEIHSSGQLPAEWFIAAEKLLGL